MIRQMYNYLPAPNQIQNIYNKPHNKKLFNLLIKKANQLM